MIIVSDETSANQINFIPRQGVAVQAILVDETTNEEFVESPVFTTSGYHTQCILVSQFVEGRRYTLKIYDSNEKVLYTDLVLCTSQELQDYSMSDGEFNYSASPNVVNDGDTSSKTKFIII